MTDQPLEAQRFLWYYVVSLLIGVASEGIGLTIGAIFKVTVTVKINSLIRFNYFLFTQNGSIAGPVTVIPMLAVAVYGMGFGTAIEPIMQALMYTSYLRFGIIGLATSVYKDRDEMICDPEEATYCHYQDPSILLRDLGMLGSKPGIQALVLLAFIVLYRITAFLALRYRLSLEFSTRLLTYLSKVLRRRY